MEMLLKSNRSRLGNTEEKDESGTLCSEPLAVTEMHVDLPSHEHPAFRAVRGSDVTTLEDYLDQGFEINSKHEEIAGDNIYTIKWGLVRPMRLKEYSLLHMAAAHGNMEILTFMLSQEVDVNLTDRNGFTPVSVAVALQRGDVVQLLIKAGADLNIQSISGRTPLIHALSEQNVTIVRMLLAAGADPNMADSKGTTPLLTFLIASDDKRVDILEALLEGGCDFDHPSKQGSTALMTAVGLRRNLMVRKLIEAGADINHTDNSGRSVLHFAIGVRMALYLINCGASVDIKDNNGHKVLDWAAHVGHVGMLRLLLSVDCQRPSLDILEVPRVVQVRQQWPAFNAWITQELGQPRELKRLCRGLIRDTLGPSQLAHVDKLPVPSLIKNFLLAIGIDLSFGGLSLERWQVMTGMVEESQQLPIRPFH